MKKTVVFDFDGVIHSYTTPWIATSVIPYDPVEGIREAIMDIRDAGYEVVVVSTRCSSPGGIEAVEAYLKYFHIPVDKVMAEKPPAVVYIDDRAICFDGNSAGLLEKVKAFKPWNKKDGQGNP